MKKIFKFFDKLEDKTRQYLSVYPILYAIIGGAAVVLFWRGVWDGADDLEMLGGIWSFLFHPTVSLVWSALMLLVTGLFVSFFIGDRIILSGLKHEKKVEEKTEEEVRAEEGMIANLNTKLTAVKNELNEIKELIKK